MKIIIIIQHMEKQYLLYIFINILYYYYFSYTIVLPLSLSIFRKKLNIYKHMNIMLFKRQINNICKELLFEF